MKFFTHEKPQNGDKMHKKPRRLKSSSTCQKLVQKKELRPFTTLRFVTVMKPVKNSKAWNLKREMKNFYPLKNIPHYSLLH